MSDRIEIEAFIELVLERLGHTWKIEGAHHRAISRPLVSYVAGVYWHDKHVANLAIRPCGSIRVSYPVRNNLVKSYPPQLADASSIGITADLLRDLGMSY